jgi:ATP-dependent Lon protease
MTDENDSAVPVPAMSDLDFKINLHFPGVVVRKDLVKAVKGNAIVPTYVLEYLLGQFAATDDEATIQAGIDTVRRILAENYVHRGEAELVKSRIRERGRLRVIDKVTVTLNEKEDVYEATFANLGISGVLVEPGVIKSNEKLLVSGVWCQCDIEYLHTEDRRAVPWILGKLAPIQLSRFDFDHFLEARAGFTPDEWIDVLMQSIGFNPEYFTRREKWFQLVRLIPFVERNYNLVELGPKGTGKSHIFSEFSPHGMLISGGEVTVAKLFVNNQTSRANPNGTIGLVGYWDVVAFDEFAGKSKRVDRALVDIMKNYLANKSFSRGKDPQGAEASMVFIGNTSHTVPHMLKHSDLFDELPDAYHDPAYLDRLHHYIPGWEVDVIRGEMFSEGYGFVVDYIAEVLHHMRNLDFSDRYRAHFELGSDISTRDRDGIHKTFSGLTKLLFPSEDATPEELEEVLRFAIEGRKRVKDQILRIDATMPPVHFGYTEVDGGTWRDVFTAEEQEYPESYYRRNVRPPGADGDSPVFPAAREPVDGGAETVAAPVTSAGTEARSSLASPEPAPIRIEFAEGQKGFTWGKYVVPYLRDATEIRIVDPYVRKHHQMRNLLELIEAFARTRDAADEVRVRLTTVEDDEYPDSKRKQTENLAQVQTSAATLGVIFNVDFVEPKKIHDRSIRTDHGWIIDLGRGLDIFQRVSDNFLDLASRYPSRRPLKAFTLTTHSVDPQ